MSRDPDKSTENLSEFPSQSCCLKTLQKRSQVDFEIDFFGRILSRDPNYPEILASLGELFSLKGWHRRALQVDQRLAQLRPRDSVVIYNLACSYAVLGHNDDALEALRRSIQMGYRDLHQFMMDRDLDSLRTHPEFMRMMQELQGANASTRIV